jgi:hypothetical protein
MPDLDQPVTRPATNGHAIAYALGWAARADIASIMAAGDCTRHEARDVKALARTMAVCARISRAVGAPA